MMKKFLLLGIIFAFPAVAQADPGVQSMLCHAATDFKPDADVAFRPGVDVKGNPVVPADVPSGDQNVILTQNVQIPLSVDLAQWLGATYPSGTRMESVLGLIELNTKTGAITYNGQDLAPNVQAACKGAKPPALELQPNESPAAKTPAPAAVDQQPRSQTTPSLGVLGAAKVVSTIQPAAGGRVTNAAEIPLNKQKWLQAGEALDSYRTMP